MRRVTGYPTATLILRESERALIRIFSLPSSAGRKDSWTILDARGGRIPRRRGSSRGGITVYYISVICVYHDIETRYGQMCHAIAVCLFGDFYREVNECPSGLRSVFCSSRSNETRDFIDLFKTDLFESSKRILRIMFYELVKENVSSENWSIYLTPIKEHDRKELCPFLFRFQAIQIQK